MSVRVCLPQLSMERLARMPEVKDSIVEDNCDLTVLSVKDRRVGIVNIVRRQDETTVAITAQTNTRVPE